MTNLLKKLSVKAKSKNISKDGKHGQIEQVQKYPDYDENYERQFRNSVEQSSSPQRPSLQTSGPLSSPGNAGRHPSTYGLQGDSTTPVPGEVYGHGGHYQGAQARS